MSEQWTREALKTLAHQDPPRPFALAAVLERGERRRRRITVRRIGAASIAAVGIAAAVLTPNVLPWHRTTVPGPAAPPAALSVTCTDAGIHVAGSTVTASPDGVHIAARSE